ncbi:ComEC/Rec2 family competence protein [Parapedobacter soli]|uniref:ComEC/Rec2 family competence protein n=1 Tax=Parapedobacter soli TaxID=416955 RepID=UPI0021C9D3A5|nr:ComEC/Rec2 family competence protein [Parapedobacter soli]
MAVLAVSPFVRFLVALVAGIGMGYAVTPAWSLYIAACGLFVFVLVSFITIRCITRLRQYRYYGVLGAHILLAWGLVGFLLVWKTDPAIDRSHFSHFESKALVGWVADEPVERSDHIRFPFVVTQAYGDDGLFEATGKLMLTVRLDDSATSMSLNYGDRLVIPTGYQAVPPPYNPGELDYGRFLAGKDIWHQDYLGVEELEKLDEGDGSLIIAYALSLRRRMVAKFSSYIPDPDAYSVASALILGYRAEIDDSLIQTFANTGTIHVLSVSGMHVVIVFWLLSLLLWWMDNGKTFRVVKFILLLLAVWGYALLTGFSPPALRASIMVSFVMAATIFGQQNRIYNSIAASAFFLLLYQPKFIVDVGFQLSYLAVLGIVFLHPLMRRFISNNNRLLRPVTDYIGMSIGAQAGAGPLAAYYFHQFPLYFLPANLLIVLPASVIMYIGFVLLLVPPGMLASWAGKMLEKLILITNGLLGYIEQWPMASVRGIWITWWETVLMYIFIVAVAMAVLVRRKQWVYSVLACTALLVCTSFSAVLRKSERKVIIFNVRRNLAIGLMDAGSAWLYTDLPAIDDRTISYSVLPALEAQVPLKAIHFLAHDSTYRDPRVYTRSGILQFGDVRLMVYDGTEMYAGHIDVDILILRNNPRESLPTLMEAVDCGKLILDGSNSNSTIARLKAEAEATGTPVYVLKDNFAYVWSLESPMS